MYTLLEIHEKIKVLRLFRKMSAQSVARQLNLSTSAYYSRESGKVIINVLELIELCRVFNISPKTLLTKCQNKDEFLTLIEYEYFVKKVFKAGEVHEC